MELSPVVSSVVESMYLSPVKRTSAVRRCSGLNPGVVRRIRTTVLIISPAQVSNTSARAISVTTNVFLVRWRETVAVLRPASRKHSLTSLFTARKAGIIPKAIPVSTQVPKVNSKTRPSTTVPAAFGNQIGADTLKTLTPRNAKTSPAIPPTRESNTLSVSIWQTKILRFAPNATRTPISFRRPSPRTSSRLATLAHAINKTSPTAPKSM